MGVIISTIDTVKNRVQARTAGPARNTGSADLGAYSLYDGQAQTSLEDRRSVLQQIQKWLSNNEVQFVESQKIGDVLTAGVINRNAPRGSLVEITDDGDKFTLHFNPISQGTNESTIGLKKDAVLQNAGVQALREFIRDSPYYKHESIVLEERKRLLARLAEYGRNVFQGGETAGAQIQALLLKSENASGSRFFDVIAKTGSAAGAILKDAQLVNSSFRKYDFQGTNCENIAIVNTDITGSNFKGANLRGAKIKHSEGVVIRPGDLNNVDFSGRTDLSGSSIAGLLQSIAESKEIASREDKQQQIRKIFSGMIYDETTVFSQDAKINRELHKLLDECSSSVGPWKTHMVLDKGMKPHEFVRFLDSLNLKTLYGTDKLGNEVIAIQDEQAPSQPWIVIKYPTKRGEVTVIASSFMEDEDFSTSESFPMHEMLRRLADARLAEGSPVKEEPGETNTSAHNGDKQLGQERRELQVNDEFLSSSKATLTTQHHKPRVTLQTKHYDPNVTIPSKQDRDLPRHKKNIVIQNSKPRLNRR